MVELEVKEALHSPPVPPGVVWPEDVGDEEEEAVVEVSAKVEVEAHLALT
jgi:hypothetical protein